MRYLTAATAPVLEPPSNAGHSSPIFYHLVFRKFNLSVCRRGFAAFPSATTVARHAGAGADLSESHVGRRRTVGHLARPMSCPTADSHGFRFGPEPEGVGKGQTTEHTAVGPGRPGRSPHSR